MLNQNPTQAETTEPQTPVLFPVDEEESEVEVMPEISPQELADLVYELMRAELRVECERRGWKR